MDDGFFEVIKSDKTCIISNGFLLNKLHNIIVSNKVDVGLIDLFKIKPINKMLIKTLEKYEKIITIEEQWLEGGLGSLIIEYLSDNKLLKEVKRYGLESRFFFENGGREHLHNNYGLNLEEIISTIRK